MWGHLIPLSPFVHSDEASGNTEEEGVGDKNKRQRDRFEDNSSSLNPLELPARFGREELLRPFSKVCPTCSSRCRGKNTASPPKKKGKPLCNICQSVQSMAKFIPRKDFWCFSYDDESAACNGKGMHLVISGNNASQLVRVCSSDGDARKSKKNQQKEDLQKLEVNDGDIVSLLWYNSQKNGGGEGGTIKSSSKLETLVQFRLVRIKDEGTNAAAAAADDDDFPDNRVVVSILVEKDEDTMKNMFCNVNKNDVVESEKTGNEKSDNAREDHFTDLKKEETMYDNNNANKEDIAKDKKKAEVMSDKNGNHGHEKNVPRDDESDAYSSSSSDDEHLWKAGGFLKTVTKDENVARGNYFRDVRAKYGDGRDGSTKQQKVNNPTSRVSIKPLANTAEDQCIGSVNGSSKYEEESESAPLTLPSQFLASYSKSFSFDSMEKSPSQLLKSSVNNAIVGTGQNYGTPQKSNQSVKRTYCDMESTHGGKDSTRTPKKSNVTISEAKTTVPISSLSYNQMVQLHKETMPTIAAAKPSLRHTVLSLTLALTSNASSYDSNFLRDCNNAEANAKCGTRDNEQTSPQQAGQQWMPRLLQGTQIKLHKNIGTDHA